MITWSPHQIEITSGGPQLTRLISFFLCRHDIRKGSHFAILKNMGFVDDAMASFDSMVDECLSIWCLLLAKPENPKIPKLKTETLGCTLFASWKLLQFPSSLIVKVILYCFLQTIYIPISHSLVSCQKTNDTDTDTEHTKVFSYDICFLFHISLSFWLDISLPCFSISSHLYLLIFLLSFLCLLPLLHSFLLISCSLTLTHCSGTIAAFWISCLSRVPTSSKSSKLTSPTSPPPRRKRR